AHLGAPLKLLEQTLPPPPAVLMLKGEEGASVLFDGQAAGQLPLRLETKGGEHSLQIRAKGFRPLETRLTLSSGQELSLPLSLTPQGLSLALESNVTDAEVRVDGAPIDKTPTTKAIFFPLGSKHTLSVVKDGYLSYEKTFLANEDKDYSLKIKLINP